MLKGLDGDGFLSGEPRPSAARGVQDHVGLGPRDYTHELVHWRDMLD